MEIRQINENDWDTFVEHSPQGTIFNKSVFLKSYGLPVKCMICYKGEEAVAGAAFVYKDNRIEVMPYSMYHGILFKDFGGLGNYRINETAFEVMEAFAVQAIACMRALGLDPVCVNPGGGALARGHPIGASGAIVAVRVWHELQRKDAGAVGLAAIAAAGGLGSAALFRVV